METKLDSTCTQILHNTPGFWTEYMDLEAHYEWSFSIGSQVLDMGCGLGKQVQMMRDHGIGALGIDPFASAPNCIKAQAEFLPFTEHCFDGILCRVSLPYTDEWKAIQEIARAVGKESLVILITHGAVYYLRYILKGSIAEKIYAARTIINTWVYAITGFRSLGDTIYQSRRRLYKPYGKVGLAVETDRAAPTFVGFPVFIYQRLSTHNSKLL